MNHQQSQDDLRALQHGAKGLPLAMPPLSVRTAEVILVDCQRGTGDLRRDVLQVFTREGVLLAEHDRIHFDPEWPACYVRDQVARGALPSLPAVEPEQAATVTERPGVSMPGSRKEGCDCGYAWVGEQGMELKYFSRPARIFSAPGGSDQPAAPAAGSAHAPGGALVVVALDVQRDGVLISATVNGRVNVIGWRRSADVVPDEVRRLVGEILGELR